MVEIFVSNEIPYLPVRVWQAFHNPGAPDMIVTARDGYALGKSSEKFVNDFYGVCGGLRQDQMSVPFILKGPGVKVSSVVESATMEDLGATLLYLLMNPFKQKPKEEEDFAVFKTPTRQVEHWYSVQLSGDVIEGVLQ